jgi:hypothetical protein
VCLFTVSEAGQLPHHSSELEVVSSVAVAADLCRIVVALKVIFVFFLFYRGICFSNANKRTLLVMGSFLLRLKWLVGKCA